MDKLMMIILTIGPTILCWKIIKSAFSSFAGGAGRKMLFSKLPLLGDREDSVTKAMSSLAGPISNPEVAGLTPSGGDTPKLDMPWNGKGNSTTTQPPSGGSGGGGLGAVVGLVNVVGAMPQSGNIRNMGLRTITGFMPQSGMIYNRVRRFGQVQQNANQIVNQMRGGKLTMNQNGNAQGQFTTKNVKVIGSRGTSTYTASRIRTIKGVDGSSIYDIKRGIKSVKGSNGNVTYRLGRGIRKINGVRGTSTYHIGTELKKIKDVNGTSTYHSAQGISSIRRISGVSNIAIHGEVKRFRAPNSNNTIVSANLSRKLRRREVLTAPKGTLQQATSLNTGNNIGLAVNDFYMPRVSYSVNAMKLSETKAAFSDPRNSGLTSGQKNKYVEINRVARDDDRFRNLGDRERQNVQDLFRYAAQNYTDLSSREILDLTATAKKLDDAQTRKERASVAERVNRQIDPRREARKQLDKMLEDTTVSRNLSQYVDDNLNDVGAGVGDKTEVENMLKEDMIDNPELMETVLGKKATEKVMGTFEKAERKRKDQVNTIMSKKEMARDIEYKNQAGNSNLTLAEARRQRQSQVRQGYFDQAAVERYPGYTSNNPATGNYNRQPYISYEPRT